MTHQQQKKTPSGHTIQTEHVQRAEGFVPRVMIKDAAGRTVYGYALNANESAAEAEEKFANGTYRYHESGR